MYVKTIEKDPAETIDVAVDFTDRLAALETIASATVSVDGLGTITVDPSPVVASPLVTIRVAAGTNGTTDSFTILATTSTGEILAATVIVAVLIPVPLTGVYFTEDDLRGQVPADFLDQLTYDGNPLAQPGNLDQLRRDASAYVDGYLGRFVPPIVLGTNGTQGTLDVLRVHTVIVAKWMLLGRKLVSDGYRNPDESFQATKSFLLAILKGAPLPGASEPGQPVLDATGSSTGGEIVFTQDSAVL